MINGERGGVEVSDRRDGVEGLILKLTRGGCVGVVGVVGVGVDVVSARTAEDFIFFKVRGLNSTTTA